MTVLILNRSPLSKRPFHDWLAGVPGGIVLLTSPRKLAERGEHLPVGDPYLHAEAVEGYENPDVLVARGLRLAESYRFDAVIAMNERDLEPAGELRDRLGLPGQSRHSATAFRDKLLMKKYATAAGVRVAEHLGVDTPRQLREFADTCGYPVVVKPRDGAGSVGVRVLRDAAELDRYAADESVWPRSAERTGLLAEGFVDGPMYHVDGIVLDGRIVAAWPSAYLYRQGGAERGAGLRLDVTLDPGDPLGQRLTAAVERLLEGFPTPPHTTFHAEFFVTPADEIVLCEIASRSGGTLIAVLLQAMYGTHFPSAYLRACAGLPVDLPRDGTRLAPRTMAGQATLLKRAGTVRAVPADPPFPWVLRYEAFVRPGQRLADARTSNDMAAAMAVTGATRAECERRLRELGAWFDSGLAFESDAPARIPL